MRLIQIIQIIKIFIVSLHAQNSESISRGSHQPGLSQDEKYETPWAKLCKLNKLRPWTRPSESTSLPDRLEWVKKESEKIQKHVLASIHDDYQDYLSNRPDLNSEISIFENEFVNLDGDVKIVYCQEYLDSLELIIKKLTRKLTKK